MKELVARCTMCPDRDGSRSYCCSLFKPDILSGQPYPCKFVKVFADEAGRMLRVCESPKHGMFKAHYQTEVSQPWKPLVTKFLPWRRSFDKAQMDLNFYAAHKGWKAVWPIPEACCAE